MTKNNEFEKQIKEKGIVLFDGYCNLCSWSVRFIIKRDKKDYFRFVALQSETGQQILANFKLLESFDKSVILIENGKVHFKSSAVLKISRKLKQPWPLTYAFIIVPKFLRNLVYDFIAKNRFKWFGRKTECYIPDKDLNYKFF